MPGLYRGKTIVSSLFLIAVTINIANGQSCTVPSFPPNLLTLSQQCLTGSSLRLGTICTYVCEEGYDLVGNDMVECTEPSQELVLPTCQAITTTSNGTTEYLTTSAGITESLTSAGSTTGMETVPSTIGPDTTTASTFGPDTTIASTTGRPDTTSVSTLGPDATTDSTLGPDTTIASTTIPDTTTSSGLTTGPDTTAASTTGPNTITASTTVPDTTVSTTSGQDPTTVSTLGPDTTTASTTGPDTTTASTTVPDTTVSTTLGPDPTFVRTLRRDPTTASTTGPDNSTASTSGPDTTTASTTGPDTTTASTAVPDTTSASTTEADTTTASTMEADTTTASTTEADTTASTMEADTTTASTMEADTTTASTVEADTTTASTTVADTTTASTTEADTTTASTTVADTTTASTTGPDTVRTTGMETTSSSNAVSSTASSTTVVNTFIVIATFLNRTFTSSLLDNTSSYFSQVAQEFINYIQAPLRNSFEETLSVTVNSFRSGSIIAEFSVQIHVGNRTTVQQDLEHLSTIHATMTEIAEANPNYLDPTSIRVLSTVTCPAGTVMTEYGSIAMFDNGAINSRANSTNATCPYYTERGGRPLEAICEGDYQSPSKWVIPQMNCGRNLTVEEILGNLKNVEVTEENAANIAEGLAAITAMGQEISQDDLTVAVDLLEQITRINSTDIQVTKSVVEIADNIAALPDEQLEDAEEEDSAPSRVVLALESQLAVVEVENGGSSRFVETNIAAEVLDVTTEDISQGYTAFMSVTDTGESISDEDFQVGRGDLTQRPEATDSQATLFIPSVLADSFSERRGRLVITTYRVPSLFQDKSIAEFNQNAEGFNRTVNSRIISASVNNEKVENLTEPVRISFVPLNPNGTNATCVFWDFDEKAWSQRGCETKSDDSTGRIECECNHLTNFGILMDIYGGDALTDQEDFILEIITYIGCLMSVWGLVLTIFTYATNKKLRDRKPNQILLSLSSALLGLYVVFLVMISLDTDRDVTELPLVPCSILAAFLHYFVLASIFWMGVEGYNMYNLFVRVLNTYLPWFMRKASLVAWGVPLLIVGVTAGASRERYAQTDFCFLTFWPLIGGLLIPIGIVMIFNFFMYIRVLTRLNKTVKGKQLNKTEKRQRLRRFQNAVCIMILMGLTWSVGYLSIIQPASAVVQGVFTVLNSLQGYFIFMLYCLRQPQVRRLWRSQFSCCLPKSFKTPSASNSSSGQTNSTYRNSSGRPVANNRNRNARLIPNSDSSGFRPDTVVRSSPERLPRPLYNNGFAE